MNIDQLTATRTHLELRRTRLRVRIDMFNGHMELNSPDITMTTERDADLAELAELDEQYEDVLRQLARLADAAPRQLFPVGA